MSKMVSALITIAVMFFVAGMFFAMAVIHYSDGELPMCQEDEYLYPLDYKGPGHNKPRDYLCWNFDDTYHD